jgi:hypothetical protein
LTGCSFEGGYKSPLVARNDEFYEKGYQRRERITPTHNVAIEKQDNISESGKTMDFFSRTYSRNSASFLENDRYMNFIIAQTKNPVKKSRKYERVPKGNLGFLDAIYSARKTYNTVDDSNDFILFNIYAIAKKLEVNEILTEVDTIQTIAKLQPNPERTELHELTSITTVSKSDY